jgi:hypothetical protein
MGQIPDLKKVNIPGAVSASLQAHGGTSALVTGVQAVIIASAA